MTTITKERLQWLANISGRDDIDDIDGSEIRELALIALASLEAEPVAWECGENIILFNPDTVEAYAKRAEISPKPLFAAPPASVVPEEITADGIIGMHECGFVEGWNACRAAMLHDGQPVSNHDELPYAQVKAVADLYALCWQSGEVVTYTPDPEKATIWLNNYSGTCVQEYVKLERRQEALAGNSPVIPEDLRRATMLQGKFRDLSQPVDPQVTKYEQIMLQAGWVMVPVEPTDEMIAAAMECEDVLFNSDGSFCVQFREIYCAMVDVAPKPEITSE
ncbi:TPA: hypothetical protein ACIPE5_002105 [Salmonella enterica subsp. diarizonae serovar 61:r:-]